MAQNHALEIAVLVFVPPGAPTEVITTIAEQLDGSEWFAQTPVTWSIASRGLLAETEVVDPIRRRMDSAGDRAATAGYTGVAHPLLLASELEPECRLALANEDGTGLLDVFPDARPILLAPYPDPRRPEAASLYARHFEATSIGVEPRERGGARAHFAVSGHTVSVPALICDETEQRAPLLQRLRGMLRRRPAGAVIAVRATSETSFEPLFAALGRLGGAANAVRFVGLEPEWAQNRGTRARATPPATETGACRMVCVRTSRTVNALRSAETPDPLQVLHTIAQERADSRYEAPCDGSPPPGRTVHASMMGTASMQVEHWEVQFSRGRLSRLSGPATARLSFGGRKQQLLAEPAGGFLRTSERSYELIPQNAFSFEDGTAGARGLMSIHRLSGEELDAPGRLLVDYTAVGDFPWLLVDLCFEFPRPVAGTEVEELVPFSLSVRLGDGREGQSITTQYPDGTGSRIDLAGTTGAGCAFGSLLQIADRATISCISDQPQITGAFRFEVRRSLGAHVLVVFPFGRFGPAGIAERAGTASRVRFALSAGKRDYEEIVAAPKAVLALHQPSSPPR